jgi:hypothetical protein
MVEVGAAAIALVLLGGSGLSKIADPDPTAGALRVAGLWGSRLGARSLGAIEIIAAIVGLALGGTFLFPAGVLYMGFAGFVFYALGRGLPIQSCGCFGRADSPPTLMHIIFNVVASTSLVALAISDSWVIPEAAPFEITLFWFLALTGAYLSYLVLAVLPTTFAQSWQIDG